MSLAAVQNDRLHRVYRYRLYPTRRQAASLEAQLNFACDLYNAALEQRRTAWQERRVSVSRKQQQHELTVLRRDYDLDMNYGAQEEAIKQLDRAFQDFFRRVRQGGAPGYPRFKSPGRFNTLLWRPGASRGGKVVNGRLRLQGIGDVKVKWHRSLSAAPKQIRVTRRRNRWTVAFTVQVDRRPLAPTGSEVGVDLGVRQFATLSNGEVFHGPRAARREAAAVRRGRRKVRRREFESKRRGKALDEVTRRLERQANRRRDAAHKLARHLVDRHDLIAIEDLDPADMAKAGRWMAREVFDQGWSNFLKYLEDKAESAGRRVIRVNPKNTSRTCHECGTIDHASRRGPRFVCTACGHEDHADLNAARNILYLARTGPSGENANRRYALSEKPLERSRHTRSTGIGVARAAA